MSVREIVTAGHPALRERAPDLTLAGLREPGTQAVIDDLIETRRAAAGAGLAAPQLGESLRIAVVEVDRATAARYPYKPPIPLTVLVNPTLEPLDEERTMINEGCLSVPGLRGEVPRWLSVSVDYLDRDGASCSQVWRGLAAGTIQHEVDHLDGILFLDRVTDPRTFMTWEEFDRRHREAFVARVSGLPR